MNNWIEKMMGLKRNKHKTPKNNTSDRHDVFTVACVKENPGALLYFKKHTEIEVTAVKEFKESM